MSRFDDSDGVTPCSVCGKVEPLNAAIAMIQVQPDENPVIQEVQTCIDLRCMMSAARRAGK